MLGKNTINSQERSSTSSPSILGMQEAATSVENTKNNSSKSTPDVQALLNYKPASGFEAAGFVQGYQIGQGINRAKEESNRDERKMGLLEEQQGWARNDYQRKMYLQQGMSEAAQNGGYDAVIDFLQVADPTMALEFNKSKLQLDQSMMQTDVMRATSQTDKLKAMAEGYGVLGKMGYALLNAPESDRDNMYQQMLPMVKAVNPNAPDNLDANAVNMFMLSVAQSTPEALLYNTQKNVYKMQTDLGQAMQDYDAAKRMYGEDSEQAKMLAGGINSISDKAIEAKKAHLDQVAQNTAINERWLMNETQDLSKEYKTTQDYYNTAQSSYKDLGDPKKAGAAAHNLIYSFGKMITPGEALNVDDIRNIMTKFGITEQVAIELQKAYKGQGGLNKDVAYSLITRMNTIYDQRTKLYEGYLQPYYKIADEKGWSRGAVFNAVSLDSASKLRQMMPNLPPVMQGQIQKALDNFADPVKVLEITNQQLQMQQQQQNGGANNDQ